MDTTSLLREEMEKKARKYECALVGKEIWWDVVVLTARDEAQAAVLEEAVREKVRLGRIPNNECVYICVPDKSDGGTGAATMNVIHELVERGLHFRRGRREKGVGEGKTNNDCCEGDGASVLLINAGGYSKRLPHTAVIGKALAPLPCEMARDALEMRLLLSIDYPALMRPQSFRTHQIREKEGAMVSRWGRGGGVFVAPSDVIDIAPPPAFSVRLDSIPGVVGIAHSAPASYSARHGVYIPGDQAINGNCELVACSRYVHKVPCLPSYSWIIRLECTRY